MSRKVPIEGLNPISDPFYRYKRPALGIKLEGRGNGKKTLITNIADVAKALHRSPGELSKFLMSQGACGGSGFNDKTGQLTMNGHKDEEELEKLMKEYTQSFVLCGNCDRPETHYRRKKKALLQKCDGCGEVTPAGDDPELEQIVKWIIRQEGEFEVPKLEEAAPQAGTMGGGSSGNSGGEKEKKKDKKEKKKDKKEKKKDKKAKGQEADDDDDERDPELVPEVKDDRPGDDDEDEDGSSSSGSDTPRALNFLEAVDAMQTFMRGRPLASLVTIELRGDTDVPRDQLFIALEAALPEDEIRQVAKSKSKLPTLKAYKSVVEPLASSVAARWVVGVVEHVFAVRYPELDRKLFPLVLHQLYEEDVLEEEDLLEWADEKERSADAHPDVSDEEIARLRDASAKFIVWLKEADSDDDDEESEDDEA